METHIKPLPGANALIVDTWKLFTSTWNASVQTSVYFLYVGLALFAAALLSKLHPAFAILQGFVSLAAQVFVVWISLRLIMTMLNLEAGKKPMAPADESRKAWSLFWSMLWVGILIGLAIFAGTILFILPGIYLAVALCFGKIILVDQNIRGTQALAASRALVNGRWWGTLWRMIAGGVVFGIPFAVILCALMGIVLAIVGERALTAAVPDPLIPGAVNLLGYVMLAAFMPLMMSFEIKLYRALQKTR